MEKKHTKKTNLMRLFFSRQKTHTHTRARTLLHKNARERERKADESDDERGAAAKRRGETFVGFDR